jgi:hypothetical protein
MADRWKCIPISGRITAILGDIATRGCDTVDLHSGAAASAEIVVTILFITPRFFFAGPIQQASEDLTSGFCPHAQDAN